MHKNLLLRPVQTLRERKTWQRALVLTLALELLLGFAMTASPWIHQRLHDRAGGEHHECVVTVMHSGASEGATAAPVLAPEFHPAAEFVAVADVPSGYITSIFLRARVFEHAPPSFA